MAVFVLFYYEQMLGLSGTLTGLAIAILILWDGIGDPLIGMWSDRLRSRIGRRHPLMIAASSSTITVLSAGSTASSSTCLASSVLPAPGITLPDSPFGPNCEAATSWIEAKCIPP
ncbi:MFS transporter [Alphaproteobacteria bacterium]|nr:MFS transporter [Alphaproteobacteria bacterium]